MPRDKHLKTKKDYHGNQKSFDALSYEKVEGPVNQSLIKMKFSCNNIQRSDMGVFKVQIKSMTITVLFCPVTGIFFNDDGIIRRRINRNRKDIVNIQNASHLAVNLLLIKIPESIRYAVQITFFYLDKDFIKSIKFIEVIMIKGNGGKDCGEDSA